MDPTAPLSWFPLALTAFLCYGIQNFLYKSATVKGLGTSQLLIVFSTIAGLICTALIPVFTPSTFNSSSLILLGVASAATFYVTILSRLEALKRLDGTIVFPIVRMQSAMLVLFGLTFIDENPSSEQLLGIVFALTVILLSFEKPKAADSSNIQRTGILLALLAMLSSAANVLICRSAAKSTDLTAFFALSFLLTALITKVTSSESLSAKSLLEPRLLKIGSAIAICNVLGAYALLSALKHGPLFAVGAIYNQSFVVSILLVLLIHKERLTLRRGILLAAAMLSLILLES